ncbi:hypothetical protein M2T55_31805, partial [Klebsiella pneumoniae]|nr:hypothetical protein [Klebsiella pneumoniae]
MDSSKIREDGKGTSSISIVTEGQYYVENTWLPGVLTSKGLPRLTTSIPCLLAKLLDRKECVAPESKST